MTIKGTAEVVLIPLAIAGVGGWATVEATRIQEESANRLAEIQANQALHLHIQGKDVDVAELFLTLLTHPDICNKPGRKNLLVPLASVEQGKRLNQHYSAECSRSSNNEQELERESTESTFIDEAARNQTLKLIAALDSPARRSARDQLAELYAMHPTIVEKELARSISTNRDNYKVALGVLVVLGKVSGGWQSHKDLDAEVKFLESKFEEDSTFAKWLQLAKKNRKT